MQEPLLQTWLNHIRVLAEEIGPRGPTTPNERKGAEYCQAVLLKTGLKPVIEGFRSATSIFHPHLLGSSLMLLAFILYPLGGRVTALLAAIISLIVLTCELQELGFVDNLFRLLVPKGSSQNVVATIPPAGEHRQDLVLIGHIDTQRTPIIFRSPRWVEAYKTFTTIVFILFILQVVLYLAGSFFYGFHVTWVWLATIPTALGSILLALICIQAESTPFTAGANDNASAVGLVLSLAEKISGSPLKHTRVFIVCTGCEEVQHYGAIDFFKRHRAEMKNPKALVFEMVGCSGPGWLTKEGIIIPFYSDPDLVAQAEQINRQHPEIEAYPVQIKGGNSELADCVRFNVPALTIFGLTRTGGAPYWHQVGDTYDKIDPGAMMKNFTFTWTIIESLDEKAAS